MQRALYLLLVISFFACQEDKQQTGNALDAIPIDAALILESNDVSKSLKELSRSAPWELLTTETSIELNQQKLIRIDSALTTYASHLTSINPLFISLHLTGAQSLNWLATTSSENQEHKFQLLELGLKNFTNTKEHPYSNGTIIEVNIENDRLFYCMHMGLVLISPEKILIQDAIRQLKTKNNLSADKSFQNIYNSSNKKEDFNLFINSENFDKISAGLLLQNSNIQNQAEWFQWDVDIFKNGILFSGLSLSFDSLAQELQFFENNQGHNLIAPSILPKNTTLFTSKCFENFKQYQRQQTNGLLKKHEKNKYDKKLSLLKIEYKDEFESWIDSEITWFLVENSTALNSGLILHIVRGDQVENYITTHADSMFEYRQQKIFKWSELKYLSNLCNTPGTAIYEYASILNNQLLLAEDPTLLKSIINDYKSEKSLSHSTEFKNCIDELNYDSNYFIYVQNQTSWQLAQKYLHKNIANFIEKYATALSPIRSFAIQFSLNGSNCYSNAYLYFNASTKDETRAIWAAQLEAPVLSEMSLAKNHYTQKWEIAVQDENLNLYLISSDGEILWKRKLQEAVIGSIRQIDLFKNNKLQLLFNTKSKLFLIDRKGRDVGTYPMALKQKTSLPLSLFDYENNRNYRILLSCGKQHYMYDKNGKIINGWKLKQTKSKALYPAEHFVVGGRDYILLAEENGKLNILNRRGETRVKVKEKIDFSSNKLQVVKGKSLAETRIVAIDKKGAQQNILFDGSIDNSIQFEFDQNIQYTYTKQHHILIEGEDLKVNGPQMNLLYSFENESLSAAKLFNVENEHYLSITDTKTAEAYLFREPNELLEGFPMYGTTTGTAEDINLDGKINFITAGESGTLYNYAVE